MYIDFNAISVKKITTQDVENICKVLVNLLNKTGESGYLHKHSNYYLLNGMLVVTVVGLAIPKGETWIELRREKDLYSFKYAVKNVMEQMLNFKELSEEKCEPPYNLIIELGGMREKRVLLQGIRTLLYVVQHVYCKRSVIVNRGRELSFMGSFIIIRIRKANIIVGNRLKEYNLAPPRAQSKYSDL